MFRIYVGNLPYRARDAELQAFFPDATEATVVLMPDGRSKGFGFVEFADEEALNKALARNGESMDGRPLRIDKARPREERNGNDAAPKEVVRTEDEVDLDQPAEEAEVKEEEQPAESA